MMGMRSDLMRVIAGELKGRRLKSVPGKLTRPTSDKIKEAVFQMMGPYFQGGTCLDLFAGSGALGIEAISRGIDHATFIEKQQKAVQTINENIQDLKLEERAKVLRIDAFKGLQLMSKEQKSYNLILIDPPYESMNYEKLLSTIINNNLLTKNGLIYCEHATTKDLPQDLSELTIIKQATYGSTTAITIYQENN